MTTQTEALTLALEALKKMYIEGYEGTCGYAITAIKEALAQPEQEPWLLETTQTLAKHMARKFYPEVTQWECLDNLAGVISQIDNMTTGLMRKPEQEPNGLAAYVIGCFGAAEAEGLQEALAETTDERLKDLVERRLMYALYEAQTPQPKEPEQEPVAWKPIETAPKDVMVLVCLPRQMNLVVRAWYNSIHNFWQTDYEGEGGITRPIYFHEGDLWHPIPPLCTTIPQLDSSATPRTWVGLETAELAHQAYRENT